MDVYGAVDFIFAITAVVAACFFRRAALTVFASFIALDSILAYWISGTEYHTIYPLVFILGLQLAACATFAMSRDWRPLLGYSINVSIIIFQAAFDVFGVVPHWSIYPSVVAACNIYLLWVCCDDRYIGDSGRRYRAFEGYSDDIGKNKAA